MRKYRKLYIIIVVAYAALLVGLSYYSLRLGNNIMLKKMIKRKK